MKILLIAGHGAGDSGAVGNGYKEAELTRELVRLIYEGLSEYQVDVDIYNQGHNAFYDVQNGTFKVGKYDYALEVHFNAASASAHGTEIFVTDVETDITVEKNIMKELKRYFTLRDGDGVKVTNFLVITTLKNMGISSALLETCFISNKNDMKVYQENKNDIANDISVSIATSFKLKRKPRTASNTHVVKYMASDRKEYYMNVYEADKLEKTGYTGYYNMVLTIGTNGSRNCYSAWDSKKKVATGTSKGTKTKGTKILCKVVGTVK